MLRPTRLVVCRALVAMVLSVAPHAMQTRADEVDEDAWSRALGTLVGRIVQYRTQEEGREARVLGRVSGVARSPDEGLSVMGLRMVEDPELPSARICSEQRLDFGVHDLWVLTGGALVRFGATLEPELRERLHLPADPDTLAPPPESAVAELEACARRAGESPIRSITLRVRRAPNPNGGEAPDAPKPVEVEFGFGFDGAEHRVQEELGEEWNEIGFSVVMRPGFRIGELTIENSNVTVMHCSDEGAWTTLDFKTGVTRWEKLRRSGNDFLVGPQRVAPFPPYSKAELDAANTGHYADCRPTLGSKRYRVRHRGKTIKTFFVLPALGC